MVVAIVIPQSARQPRRQLHQPASVAGNVPRRSRSPQGHRGTEAVQQPVASTIAVLIDAELGRYLAPAVSLDVSNKIKGLQRRNAKREKLQKDITELREGHLPPGYIVFPHAFETHLLNDLVLQDEISRQVDASISVREAKKRFHLEHVQPQCELEFQLLEKHRAQLKTHTRKEVFVERCVQNFPSGPNGDSAAAFLDLEESDAEDRTGLAERGIAYDQYNANFLAIYREILDAQIETKRLEVEKQTANRKRYEAVVRQVVNQSPEQFLIDAIDSGIAISKAKLKAKPSAKGHQPTWFGC